MYILMEKQPRNPERQWTRSSACEQSLLTESRELKNTHRVVASVDGQRGGLETVAGAGRRVLTRDHWQHNTRASVTLLHTTKQQHNTTHLQQLQSFTLTFCCHTNDAPRYISFAAPPRGVKFTLTSACISVCYIIRQSDYNRKQNLLIIAKY